jgi:hypothetical protein
LETVGRGRLTERLLAQGLLTPNMMQALQREWSQVTIKKIQFLFQGLIKLIKLIYQPKKVHRNNSNYKSF